MQSLTIRRPDDWHVHLRDGAILEAVAPSTARQFARAVIMPNLVPPVTSVEAAAAYRERIRAAAGAGFEPLMTAYLTDEADPYELARGFADGVWVAAKLYPAGATTNSAGGVTAIRNIYPALERMQAIGMVLCVHGEVADPDVDVFDREAVFIDRVLSPLVDASPHQPQCFVRRRAQAARLLPTGRQAGGASTRRAQGCDLGLYEILPGNGQCTAHPFRQGISLRLRRNLQRALRAGKLCRSVRGGRRSRPFRRICRRARRPLLRRSAE